MNTKYKKVAVSERLPEKEGDYLVEMHHLSDLKLYYFLDDLHDSAYMKTNVEYWLEEVTDHEDEMKEMLTEFTEAIELESIIIKENIDNDGWENFGGRFYDKAKSLLTKIKQQ